MLRVWSGLHVNDIYQPGSWSLRVNHGSQHLTAASVVEEDLLFAQGRKLAPNGVHIHSDDQETR